MKKILATIFVASLVVGADAYTLLPGTTNNVSWLPLGSTNVMIAQLEKEAAFVLPRIASGSSNNVFWNFGGCTNYNPSLGPIQEVLKESVTNTIKDMFRTNDTGTSAFMVFSWQFYRTNELYENGQMIAPIINSWENIRPFTIAFDTNGEPVIPPSVFAWPFTDDIAIRGALRGVKMVKYVLTYTNGLPVRIADPFSTNGVLDYDQEQDGGDYLFLDTSCTDPDYIRTNHYHGEVRLYYEWGQFDYSPDGQRILNPDGTTYRYYPTMYDAFDMLTGQKIHSCAVKLGVIMTNGAPLITVHSAPGTEVQIQTSSDMKNWTGSDATTICTGKGGWVTFSPPSPVSGTTGATVVQSASPQFFRAVRLYPP